MTAGLEKEMMTILPGDWQVNETKLGGSLAELITRVHEQV